MNIPSTYYPAHPDADTVAWTAAAIRDAAEAIESGADSTDALERLSAQAGRSVVANEVGSFWSWTSAEELAVSLLRPGPEQLPMPTKEIMVEMVAYLLGPNAEPELLGYWTDLLTWFTGDAGFSDLIFYLEPGPSPTQIVDLALKRASGEPVSMVPSDILANGWRLV